MTAIPRIQGRVGQIEDPEDIKGKWAFEITISMLGDPTCEPHTSGPFGPWDSEKIALEELEKAVKLCTEKYEEAVTGEVSGQYYCVKTDSVRRWDRSDEN